MPRKNIDFALSILGPQRTAYLPGSSLGGEGLSELVDNDIMVDANQVLRIFWPSDAPRGNTQGVILGWRNAEFDLLVISILHEVEVKPSEISRLRSFFC